LVVDLGTPQLQTSITNFRWLNRIDPKEFSIEGRAWDDFTDDPTKAISITS